MLDEEEVAGTLTEAGGEPAVIQPVEDGSFDKARFIFFTGSPEFVQKNTAVARKSRGQMIDLSGASTTQTDTEPWFPHLERLRGSNLELDASLYLIPSALAVAAAMLSYALEPLGLQWLSFVGFQPVSDAGRAGIEELESQTGQLLSFQPVGQPIFDTQVAFNMAANYGAQSRHKLRAVRQRVFEEMQLSLPPKGNIPTVQIIHAPVFYGSTFSATAELQGGLEVRQLSEACAKAGFQLLQDGEQGPTNLSAAGENVIQLACPERANWTGKRWLLWGAADNIRFRAWNALKLAEKLAG
ncbi:MAG TPA: Asd/ArgC dimerization domain-containing protein [Candidatus Acidoferrum sp.]|nr:Asd/ArgC dimerization domain-containing protein [Candidatus Acidoferrum sp.]